MKRLRRIVFRLMHSEKLGVTRSIRLSLVVAIVIFHPLPALPAQSQSPLVTVSDIDYPPISYLEDGAPKGLGIDLIRALGKELHRDVSIRLLEWSEAQQMVLTGQADLAGPLGVTAQRKDDYDLSDPVTTFEYSFSTLGGSASIRGIDDLRGKSVAVTTGGYPRQFLSRYRDIIVIPVETYQEGLILLFQRKIQAFAADKWVTLYHIRSADFQNVKYVDPPFAVTDAAFALRKGRPQLLAEVNAAIARMRNGGEISKIEADWGDQHILVLNRAEIREYIIGSGGVVLFVVIALLFMWVVSLRREMVAHERVSKSLLEKEIERNRLEQLLAQANKMEAIGQLAGGIAHDFNNLIGAIRGYATIVRDQSPAGGAIATYAAKILKTSEYGTDLVSQILAFARGEPVVRSVFPVEGLFAEAIELLQVGLPSAIDLKIDAVPISGTFHADRAQLLQAVVNLGINARDALNGRAGRIRLGLAEAAPDSPDVQALLMRPSDRALQRTVERVPPQGGINKVITGILTADRLYAVLTVEDDADGIAQGILPKIFEPLFTTKEGNKGTGFGLATTHATVMAHSGAIVVTSRPGAGTRFDLYLPMIRPL